MEYIYKNLESLKKNRNKLYEKVKEKIENGECNFDKFNIINTKNGQKTIEITTGDRNIRLNSTYNPELEAERWANKYDFRDLDKLIIMFGIANGVFVKAIINKMKKNYFLILMEPDESLFIYSLYNFDLAEIIESKNKI